MRQSFLSSAPVANPTHDAALAKLDPAICRLF
jgi:hypothetical protein